MCRRDYVCWVRSLTRKDCRFVLGGIYIYRYIYIFLKNTCLPLIEMVKLTVGLAR